METAARISREKKGFMYSDLAGSPRWGKNESAIRGQNRLPFMFQLLATIAELSASNGRSYEEICSGCSGGYWVWFCHSVTRRGLAPMGRPGAGSSVERKGAAPKVAGGRAKTP